jgi:hypothetical protein
MTTNLEPSPDLLLVKPRRRLLRRHRVLGRSNEGIGAERRWKVQRVTMSVFCVATSGESCASGSSVLESANAMRISAKYNAIITRKRPEIEVQNGHATGMKAGSSIDRSTTT